MDIKIGTRFHSLVVLMRSPRQDPNHRILWICQCDCGSEVTAAGIQLRKGSAKSCGCVYRQNAKKLSTTHGLTGTPEYRAWSSMKARCLNPHVHNYADWGGRGIIVCSRWLDSFETFLADMGPRPKGLSLDRFPDVNGNYEPSNCRWATAKQQVDNRRKTGNLSAFSIEELQAEIERRQRSKQ
jgi:hypothetical protein